MNNERKITREYPIVDDPAKYWTAPKQSENAESKAIGSISCQTRESASKTNPGFNPFEQPYREQMDTLRDEPDHIGAQPEIEVGEDSLPDGFLDEDERQPLPMVQNHVPAESPYMEEDISHLAVDRDPPPVKVGKPVGDTTYRAVLGSASPKKNSYFEKAIETIGAYRMSNPRTNKKK